MYAWKVNALLDNDRALAFSGSHSMASHISSDDEDSEGQIHLEPVCMESQIVLEHDVVGCRMPSGSHALASHISLDN